MEHIIKALNQQLLQDWGFTYDGFYWLHKNFIFKLQNTNKEGTYLAEIEGVPAGQNPPPLSNNSHLMQLIIQTAQVYIQNELKNKTFLNASAQGKAIAEIVSNYLDFEPRLHFRLAPDPSGMGMGLMPEDEFTYTLISGYECEFRVVYESKEGGLSTEILYYNPECISYGFLKQLHEDAEPVKVHIVGKDKEGNEELTSFFGCGIPKLK